MFRFRETLNNAINACGGKQESLAAELNVSPGTLSKKINGESGFYEVEIDKILELAGGCRRCNDRHKKEIYGHQIVMKVQFERIEELEKQVSRDNNGVPVYFAKDGQ